MNIDEILKATEDNRPPVGIDCEEAIGHLRAEVIRLREVEAALKWLAVYIGGMKEDHAQYQASKIEDGHDPVALADKLDPEWRETKHD